MLEYKSKKKYLAGDKSGFYIILDRDVPADFSFITRKKVIVNSKEYLCMGVSYNHLPPFKAGEEVALILDIPFQSEHVSNIHKFLDEPEEEEDKVEEAD